MLLYSQINAVKCEPSGMRGIGEYCRREEEVNPTQKRFEDNKRWHQIAVSFNAEVGILL